MAKEEPKDEKKIHQTHWQMPDMSEIESEEKSDKEWVEIRPGRWRLQYKDEK
jgi:hypothetical protein